MKTKLRVLVVDDSTVFRKVVRDALAQFPTVEVIGHAVNGSIGLKQVMELKPDLVTLDIEMPELNGLQVLQEIKSMNLNTDAIMVSSLTGAGARSTTQALTLGAFDFILKPSGSNIQDNIDCLRTEFEPKIQSLLRKRGIGLTDDDVSDHANSNFQSTADQDAISGQTANRRDVETDPNNAPQIVMIGTSTGGPAALSKMLPMLPSTLPVPVLIVQHMPPMFTKTLADDLNRNCALEVKEASGGELIRAGQVFIAPGGRHMKAVRTQGGVMLRITDDPPVLSCRPSVDYLFRSVGQAYENMLAVIMTGMGDDGFRSLAEMKSPKLKVVTQDQASSTVYGMPRAVAESGISDVVCSLDEIAGVITRSTRHSVAPVDPSVSITISSTESPLCI